MWKLLIGVFGCMLVSSCVMNNQLVPLRSQPEHPITVEKSKGGWRAIPPRCPDLFDEDGNYYPAQNQGCSNAYNLAVMIAHPRDLTNDPKRDIVHHAKPLGTAAAKYFNDDLQELEPRNNFNSFGVGGAGGVSVGVGGTP